MKKLDLNKSVYELCQEYPELIDILAGLGFTEITKKTMLHSVGKIMTIPKGAKMKGISMMDIISALMEHEFEFLGDMPNKRSRTEQLKVYLKRLGEGETLEVVKSDFVREFQDVDASEIMQAEQELLEEGMPLSEAQKLCDVHSALFHGSTVEEKEIEASFSSRVDQMESIVGHPLYTFTKENEALSELLKQYKETQDQSILTHIREVSIHYAKKGDLLYPLLKVKYGISGPSDVMWTVDDEIRDEMSSLCQNKDFDKEWNVRMDAIMNRMEEMIYKEQNILFPICADNFTKEQWYGIYQDSKDYEICLGVNQYTWLEAENTTVKTNTVSNGEIVMPGGHLNIEQLIALLNTIPMEISFVDVDNINRFFNEGKKVFKRPGMAIDREVFSCHPPKIEPMVRKIIDDFRNNRRDCVSVWMNKGGHEMLVKYMAVKDKDGKYLGTAEFVQDMEFAKEHFSLDK